MVLRGLGYSCLAGNAVNIFEIASLNIFFLSPSAITIHVHVYIKIKTVGNSVCSDTNKGDDVNTIADRQLH